MYHNIKTNLLSEALIAFCLAIILLKNGIAENANEDSLKSYNIKEIIVTGTRTKSEIDKVPASITVINNKEISQSNEPNILPVLGNEVPGLFIDDRNVVGFGVGPNASGIISIRGIGSNPNSDVLILIDGQPQYMGIFGHPIVDALNTSDIQRVEILRGPGSILYGSNAMGGAINIITKKLQYNIPVFNTRAFYGTYKTINISGSAGYVSRLYGIYVSYNNIGTDGNRTETEDNFNTNAGYLKFTLTPECAFKFTLDGDVSESKFYDPGPIYDLRKNNYYNYLRSRGALSIENSFTDIEGALKFYYSYGKHDFFDGWDSFDEMKGITFYQNIKYFRENEFTVGVDYKNYGGKGSNPNFPPFAAQGLGVYHFINETAVYGLMQYSPFDQLNLDGGLRYTNNSLFGIDIIPEFGFTYSFSSNSTIKGSVSKAFRCPTIAELYLFPVANQNLKPEGFWNYELSYDRLLMNNLIELETTIYYDHGNNLIQTVSIPPFIINENSGSFIHKGIEFTWKYLMNENFNLSVNYSYLDCNQLVLYAPKHKLNLELVYSVKHIQLLLNLEQISGLYSSISKSLQQNYIVTDATINYSITKIFGLFLISKNLLNKNYQIDDGYPMPGRTIWLGFKLHYE